MSKGKFIYQLMTDKDQFCDAATLAERLPHFDHVFDIDDSERKAAIEKLGTLLPGKCFSVKGETITYHGSTKACAEDYAEQLVNHAYDVRFSGFAHSVMTTRQAMFSLYFMSDLFFVGYNTTRPLTLPQLLAYLERTGCGETVFTFGSITLAENAEPDDIALEDLPDGITLVMD